MRLRTYLTAFSLTWGSESLVVYALLRRASWHRVLLVELALNLVTHPLLWFGLLRLPGPYLRNLFIAEFLIALVEAMLAIPLYRGLGLSRRRIATAVVLANAATFLMTFVL